VSAFGWIATLNHRPVKRDKIGINAVLAIWYSYFLDSRKVAVHPAFRELIADEPLRDMGRYLNGVKRVACVGVAEIVVHVAHHLP
jgi:hypothetical protein